MVPLEVEEESRIGSNEIVTNRNERKVLKSLKLAEKYRVIYDIERMNKLVVL